MPNADSQHLQVVQGLIEKTASWILRNRPHPPDPVAEVARYVEPVGRLLDAYPVFGPDGAPTPHLLLLGESLGLADISAERGLPIVRVAEAYLDMGREIDMLWHSMSSSAAQRPTTGNRWPPERRPTSRPPNCAIWWSIPFWHSWIRRHRLPRLSVAGKIGTEAC
jgi:hypothetical protein